jgi:hypothetical protein
MLWPRNLLKFKKSKVKMQNAKVKDYQTIRHQDNKTFIGL